ncbi:redoxin family protein, partial [Vibrio kagoshimensis]|uniref:redoxin family protein n=1 Tax=Vibrio kagoshimensis TaxID=2910244 RepID=UPI003D19D71D
MRNKLFLLVITSLAIALSFSLALGSKQRSSTIQVMDRVFPEFTEYDLLLGDQTITRSDITKSKYQLINIWASWCGICKTEHPFLNQLKIEGIPIYGINYRDNKLSAIKVLEKVLE